MGEMFIVSGHSFQQEKLRGDLNSFFRYLTSQSVEEGTFYITSLGRTETGRKRHISDKNKEDMQIGERYPGMERQLLEAVSFPSLAMQQGGAGNT